jgi:hypothetical protein
MRATFVLALVLVAACSRPKPVPSLARGADARFDFRPTAWEAYPPEEAPKRHVVEDLLCAGTCDPLCSSLVPRDAARCALDLVYAEDADARDLARGLFDLTGALPGIERARDVDAAHLGRLPVEPVVPMGEYRRHLLWLRDAFSDIERTFADVTRRAPQTVMFRTRPYGFRFFRTAERSYPSAYATDGVIGWNVEGPLHESAESVAATLLHEIFHLNDEGHASWTSTVLTPIFDRIVQTCGDDHECLTPFAPIEDLTEGGTYYPFDSRTRDVREYGAELALRWFRAVRAPSPGESAFKCRTAENSTAWRALVDEFFGGFDPDGECPTLPPGQ